MTRLFAAFNTNTNDQITATECLIAQLQADLEQARQNLANWQQQQQAEMTASGAAASALEATAKAFKAVLAAYGEEGVEEFKNALCDLAGLTNPIALLNGTVGSSEPQTEPAPTTEDTTEEPTTVDVEVVAATTTDTPNDDDEPDFEEEGDSESQTEKDTDAALHYIRSLEWSDLKALAKALDLRTNRRTRPQLEADIAALGLSKETLKATL